ncbi:DUF1015 family protein [Bacillus cytotoxicus]|uniref:DUF1015 family protein n=1 Tax=Bacillus cytotoxicus TaxID=580165 RepID=A0ACC6AAB5_9BACI|nr:DUF1015 family protein [Bacillus cytotoxicus]
MVTIKPFRAIRPIQERAKEVAALPYDVLSSKEAKEIAKDNPYSFLHIDKAEIDLDPSISPYDNAVYEKAKGNLQHLIEEGVLIQEEHPYFYIYELTMNGRSQTGLVVCTSIDEYLNETIKKHERTRPEKETDRIRHVDVCNAHTGPIFVTYRGENEIVNVIANWKITHNPVYDFMADDAIEHKVWIIHEESVVATLIKLFEDIPSLYIADGHHRSASAVKVGMMRREAHGDYTGEEEFNSFLSVLFPKDELAILDYNRIVKDINGLTEEQFLEAISQAFYVEKAEATPFKATERHTFGMYLKKVWYKLTVKEGRIDENDVVNRLDVSILQEQLLHTILQIDDPRTNDRIDFVGGIRGLGALERMVDEEGWAVAFSMYPTTMEDLLAIADEGEVMPPKSTWFEPKLRSGLFIHSLE